MSGSPTDPTLQGDVQHELQGDVQRDCVRKAIQQRLFDAPAQWPQIGRYQVRGKLGEGGMGVVYRAHDPELDRPVAIKVLHGAENSPARTTRLRREAQALARLSHANVVEVFEIGSHGDQLYVVMELVHGQALDAWLSREKRPYKQVLEVLLQAGAGLEAAHRAGIVHRDFKPANVLVGDDGRTRVVDFGLARDWDQNVDSLADDPLDAPNCPPQLDMLAARLTETGGVLGTPAYMSPEQYKGMPAGPASDQWSFCVTLYEALYGARPFSGKSVTALAQHILSREIDEAAATAQAHRVAAWLRPIVLRGLELDSKGRFATMHALLHALGSSGAAVRRRNLAGVFAVTLAGLAMWAWATPASTVANACTATQRALGEMSSPRHWTAAKAGLQGVGASYASSTIMRVERMLDTHTQELSAALDSACPGHKTADIAPSSDPGALPCVDRRIRETMQLLERFAEADRATLEHAVHMTRALEPALGCATNNTAAPELRPTQQQRQHVQRLWAQVDRVKLLKHEGRYAEGLEAAGALVTATESIQHDLLTSSALYWQGRFLAAVGDDLQAEAVTERAFQLANANGHTQIAYDCAVGLIALVGTQAARYEEAENWGRHARSVAERDGHPVTTLENTLGNMYRHRGQYDVSLRHLERARELIGAGDNVGHTHACEVLFNLGCVHLERGAYDKAQTLLEESQTVCTGELGEDHPKLTTMLETFAILSLRQGKLNEAISQLQEVVRRGEATVGADPSATARALNNLGSALGFAGRFQDAAPVFARSLAIRRELNGDVHLDTAGSLHNLAELHQHLGQFDTARRYMEEAIAIYETIHGAESEEVADGLLGLGHVLSAQQHYDKALTYYARALALYKALLGESHAKIARTYNGIGSSLNGLGKNDAAIEAFETCVSVMKQALGHPHPELTAPMGNLGGLLHSVGREREAQTLLQEAVANAEATKSTDRVTFSYVLAPLAIIELAQGRHGEAAKLARRAMELRTDIDPAHLAETQFLLARSLYPNREHRKQALVLARAARDAMLNAGPAEVKELARVQAWLVEHAP